MDVHGWVEWTRRVKSQALIVEAAGWDRVNRTRSRYWLVVCGIRPDGLPLGEDGLDESGVLHLRDEVVEVVLHVRELLIDERRGGQEETSVRR